MPLYEYQCDACGNRFERIQKFSDPILDTCPLCQGTVRKLLSSPAIQFKGSGWYITDYAKKPSTGNGDKPASSDDSSSKDGSSSKTEKPATAAEGSGGSRAESSSTGSSGSSSGS